MYILFPFSLFFVLFCFNISITCLFSASVMYGQIAVCLDFASHAVLNHYL